MREKKSSVNFESWIMAVSYGLPVVNFVLLLLLLLFIRVCDCVCVFVVFSFLD